MTELGPVDRMRELIEGSLDQGSGGDLLAAWLQGFRLPLVGTDEEPYVWILRGLAEVPERADAERKLARWAGEILDSKPDIEPTGELPDRLLANLLMFSAGLASPDELSEPLLQMYRRKKLAGDFRGVDYRSMLRSALASNQRTNELETVWTKMALGGGNGFLPGNAFNGLEGLTLMPDPEQGEGYPAIEALGIALGHQVELLAGRKDRDEEFGELIDQVIGLYPGIRRRLFQGLRRIAARDEWPSWCVECFKKVQRSALLETETRSAAEKILAGIWTDLLGREEIPIEDRFFYLVGDSSLALNLVKGVSSPRLTRSTKKEHWAEFAALLADKGLYGESATVLKLA